MEILYKYGISYEHMPSGIDDLTIIFDKSQLSEQKKEAVALDIRAALRPDELRWIDDYSLIMIVGEGMRNQGASEISIMLGTKSADADRAVKYIYEAFFE